MRQLFYPLALGLMMLSGCSKDAPEAAQVVLEGEYQAGTTVTTAPIRMYTKDGAVNNQALIERFVARRTWAAAYFPRTDTPIPTTSSLKVIVRGNNQADLISTSPGRTDTLKTDITAQRAAYAVLSGRDSVSTLSSSNATGR